MDVSTHRAVRADERRKKRTYLVLQRMFKAESASAMEVERDDSGTEES